MALRHRERGKFKYSSCVTRSSSLARETYWKRRRKTFWLNFFHNLQCNQVVSLGAYRLEYNKESATIACYIPHRNLESLNIYFQNDEWHSRDPNPIISFPNRVLSWRSWSQVRRERYIPPPSFSSGIADNHFRFVVNSTWWDCRKPSHCHLPPHFCWINFTTIQ